MKASRSWRPWWAAAVAAVIGTATAVVAAEKDPRYAAYLSLSFGQSELPRQFHYGLRLDHDAWQATYGQSVLPPLLQLDMSGSGFEARLQGLSLNQFGYQLNQAEAGGLFGMGTVGTAAAAAGAVAVVVIAVDSGGGGGGPPDDGGETTGGETAGGETAGGETGGGTPTGGLLGFGYTSLRTPGAAPFLARDRSVDAERQRWLDGGTGQMGDLR